MLGSSEYWGNWGQGTCQEIGIVGSIERTIKIIEEIRSRG